jgi:hypothetical protein
MKILSFDCANRSLAICYMTINENLHEDIQNKLSEFDKSSDISNQEHVLKMINPCITLIDNHVKIHLLKVFDLTKKKKCASEERAVLLKQRLKEIDEMIIHHGYPTQVLIEYQMVSNDKSRCVSQQILYHYTDLFNNCPVFIVGPTLKNKIYFAKHLEHSIFMEKYVRNYTANKNHTKANLLHWLKLFKQEHFLKGVAKRNIDDIADAFMQIFGWLYYRR